MSALLLLASCSSGTDHPPDSGDSRKSTAAYLEEVTGAVKRERAGKAMEAQPGALLIGDAVETGENGQAKIRFPGGRLVEVGPDARFTLAEGEGGLVLDLARGLVLTRVPNEAGMNSTQKTEPQVSLAILTPFGLTRVGKSEVAVEVGKDSASVEVKIGMIELVSRNGEITPVAAGQKFALDPRGGRATLILPTVQVVIWAGGKSELKKKDSRSWVAVGKKPLVLTEGDLMRVNEGRSTLQAEGSGTRLVFGRGAEVGFGGTSNEGGIEETRLELKKGEVSGTLALKQKSRVKLGGMALMSDLGGQFTLTRTADGYDINALAGDFRLEREGTEPKLLKGGQSARVGAKGLEVSEPIRDQLTLPPRLGIKVFHLGLNRVSLVWDGEEGKAYRVEVSAAAAYSDPLLAGVVHQRFVSLPVPARGNLYWRVFDADAEIERGSAAFAPEPRSGAELDLRRNEVHDGADKTTIYYQDKPPAVTFTFAPDSSAVKYKVAVFNEGALGVPVVERSVKESQVVLDGALAEGKYLWSVTPLDAKGAGLRGGKMNKLEIVYDNAVPNLIIKAPKNGDPGGNQVSVVGIAPVGSKLFVNGKSLELDDKARFSSKAAPFPGGRLIFRMVGKNGADVYTVRTVRR